MTSREGARAVAFSRQLTQAHQQLRRRLHRLTAHLDKPQRLLKPSSVTTKASLDRSASWIARPGEGVESRKPNLPDFVPPGLNWATALKQTKSAHAVEEGGIPALTALGLGALSGGTTVGIAPEMGNIPDASSTSRQSVPAHVDSSTPGTSTPPNGAFVDSDWEQAERIALEAWTRNSQPISKEEMDRRVQKAIGNTVVHSYPDDPEDTLLEPPPLDDDGEPLVATPKD